MNDVLQDTIIDIFNGIKKLKSDKLFKTWAIKILLNNCNSLLKDKYKANNIISYEEYIQTSNDIENNEKSGDDNLKFDFDEIMNILSDHEKVIFVMFYQENYKINEIAAITETNINTVKSILKRGREKIRANFKELR